MSDIYGVGNRSQEDFNRMVLKFIREQRKPAATETQRVVDRVVEAKLEASAATEQIELSRQVDPSNLFDMRPIIAQDASMFWAQKRVALTGGPPDGTGWLYEDVVPNITAWFEDGFEYTATGADERIVIGNAVAFARSTTVQISARFSATFTAGAGAKAVGLESRFVFEPGVDGIDYPSYGPFPSLESNGTYSDPGSVLAASPSDALGNPVVAWRPCVGIRLPNAGDKVIVRGFRVIAVSGSVVWDEGTTVPESAIPDDTIVRRMIAPGAVGQAELDPGISFGVPDGGVTTPKIADLAVTTPKLDARAVTGPKIALATVAREHVAPLQGALATFKTGYQQHSAFATTEVIVGMDGVVQCYFATSAAVAMTCNANTGYIFANIPAEFAPAIATVRICYGATSLGRTFIRVNTNGDLVFEGNTTGTFAVGNTLVLGELSWRMKP